MNKVKHTIAVCMILSTLFCNAADHRTKRNRRHRRTKTMNLAQFNQHVEKRSSLIHQIRQAEQAIPTQPQDYALLQSLYDRLLPFAHSDAETARWTDYRKTHEQRHAIMHRICMPEHHASSSCASVENLHHIKVLLTQWKKLQKTYGTGTEHFIAFQEKVSILEQVAAQTEMELKIKDFQHMVQNTLSRPLTHALCTQIYHHADRLFGRKSDIILSTLPEMKHLAMKLGQTHWQQVMSNNQPAAPSSSKRRTITRQEHAQFKTKTSIATISCQREITPLERATALATLYKQLANQSSDENAQTALESSHYYTKIKKQLLDKQKLEVLESAEDVPTLKEAMHTALKLRDSFPGFHPKHSEYEQKALMLTLKVAHLEKDPGTICDIKMNDHTPQIMAYANRLLDRLSAEKELSKMTSNHKPYNDLREAALTLISTYNAENSTHEHLVNKTLRSDLRHEIETLQQDHTMCTIDRYKNLLCKLHMLIATYPISHPKITEYKKTIATLQTLKQIEFHKATIQNNKDQPLDRLRAYVLQQSYARLIYESDRLIMLTSESQTPAHIAALGDLLKHAQHYAHHVKRFDLLNTLNTVEQANPEANQEIINVLDKLIALPIVNLHEKDELIEKRKQHNHCIQQKAYLHDLAALESAKKIDYEACITLIKKLRALSTLSIEEIILLENKLDKYQTLLSK